MTQQMGGNLRLHSEMGVGTTAEIRLPAAKTHMLATESPSEAAIPRVPSLRVVAVDDDSLVLLNTVAMLEEMGHTVLEARTGAAALSLIGNNPIDLVITDQAMPQMTGIQLMEKIRAQQPGLPVIVATGYAELPSGHGPDVVVLSKPFLAKSLERAIAKVVGHMQEASAI
jgi:CheY-like chemotaxis protein